MNIAIFGGSFDPIHIGHKTIIKKSLKQLDIDKLIIVPTYLNPFKSSYHFTALQRFDLVKELFENNDKIVVTDFETKQQKPIATIETVQYLKSLYDATKIYLIIGADNIKGLEKWDQFDLLKQLVEFVVVTRYENEVKNDINLSKKINMNINISSTSLREEHNLDYIPKKIAQKVKQIWNKE